MLGLKIRFAQLGLSCILQSSSLKTQCFLPELKRTRKPEILNLKVGSGKISRTVDLKRNRFQAKLSVTSLLTFVEGDVGFLRFVRTNSHVSFHTGPKFVRTELKKINIVFSTS